MQGIWRVFSDSKILDHSCDIEKMAVWLLPELFDGLVVTTNLDQLLEYVYEKQGHSFSKVYLPGEGPTKENYIMREPDAHYLYKFHGPIEKSNHLDYSKIVITEEQYERNYSPDSDVVRFLKKVYKQKSLLFLGCSLEYGKTLDIFRDSMESGMINYAIVPCCCSSF